MGIFFSVLAYPCAPAHQPSVSEYIAMAAPGNAFVVYRFIMESSAAVFEYLLLIVYHWLQLLLLRQLRLSQVNQLILLLRAADQLLRGTLLLQEEHYCQVMQLL